MFNRCWPASGWSRTPQLWLFDDDEEDGEDDDDDEENENEDEDDDEDEDVEPSIIGVKGETARGVEERRTLGGGVSGTRVGNRGERGCAVPMKRTMEAGCSFVCGHCCSPGRKHELRALLSLSLSQQSTTPLRHSSFRTVSFYSPRTTPLLTIDRFSDRSRTLRCYQWYLEFWCCFMRVLYMGSLSETDFVRGLRDARLFGGLRGLVGFSGIVLGGLDKEMNDLIWDFNGLI